MKISTNGIKLLEKWEGFKSKPYQCSAGVWTIGIGSTYLENGEPVTESTPEMPYNAACELLARSLKVYEVCVNREVHVPLAQNQFDALVVFTYNVGCGAFVGSTALRKLNEKDYQGCADSLLQWNKVHKNGQLVAVEGLTNRRKDERALFLNAAVL